MSNSTFLPILTPQDKKVLREIIRKITTTHWVKYHYRMIRRKGLVEPKECYCLTGHVNVACGEHYQTASTSYRSGNFMPFLDTPERKRRDRILKALEQVISERMTTWHYGVEGFNDAPDTVREDVIEVCERALEL